MPYAYSTFAQAKAALALRLSDTGYAFWTAAELGAYIWESLRTRNALTNEWIAECTFAAPVTPTQTWYDVSQVTNSPRARTVLDTDLYTVMQYHLLENPTGGAMGSGSGQFSISDLAQALQRRRDETIIVGKLAMKRLTQASTLARREFVPDSVLEIERLRWLPVTNPAGYSNNVLAREDSLATEYFNYGAETSTEAPSQFGVLAGPPLQFEVDTLPPINATYEMLAVQAGDDFVSPYGVGMAMPDDLTWIPKWGALADLFAKGAEATDTLRAQYCLARYQDGLKVIAQQPWLLLGRINNLRVDTPSVSEQDQYAFGWEDNTSADSCIVVGGMDLVAPCPIPTVNTGITLSVVMNAPVPASDAAYIQCPRDAYDSVLDYAQSLALLKQGADEVQQSGSLVKNFVANAMETNKRLAGLGIYRDLLLAEGNRAEAVYGR